MKMVNVDKKFVDKLVEECSENIIGKKMIYTETLNNYGKICNSGTAYIVLFIILVSISNTFIYFY